MPERIRREKIKFNFDLKTPYKKIEGFDTTINNYDYTSYRKLPIKIKEFGRSNTGFVVADSKYGRLLWVNESDGKTFTIAEGLGQPTGVAVDSSGYIVTDVQSGRVLRVLSDGQFSVICSGLGKPTDVIVDFWASNYIVVDSQNGTLLRIESNGSTQVVANNLGNPIGVSMTQGGDYLVTNIKNISNNYDGPYMVSRITPSGTVTHFPPCLMFGHTSKALNFGLDLRCICNVLSGPGGGAIANIAVGANYNTVYAGTLPELGGMVNVNSNVIVTTLGGGLAKIYNYGRNIPTDAPYDGSTLWHVIARGLGEARGVIYQHPTMFVLPH
jgi:hypothetical protein